MREEFSVGVIVGSVLLTALVGMLLSSSSTPTGYLAAPVSLDDGGFKVRPVEYGGAIRSASSQGFVGRAIDTQQLSCFKCEVAGDVFGYSAIGEQAAREACSAKGGTISLWHQGECSAQESA